MGARGDAGRGDVLRDVLRHAHGVPPLALAGGGLAVGAIGLGVLGVVGVLPMRATTAAPTYAGEAVPWWLPFVGLGVITAAIAYTTGIAASRRLARGWPPSWRCSRSSPRLSSRGCCSTSSRARCSSSAARSSWPGSSSSSSASARRAPRRATRASGRGARAGLADTLRRRQDQPARDPRLRPARPRPLGRAAHRPSGLTRCWRSTDRSPARRARAHRERAPVRSSPWSPRPRCSSERGAHPRRRRAAARRAGGAPA